MADETMTLDYYDAGLLNNYGGGNVDWWFDYIREELGRAHAFYQSQVDSMIIDTIDSAIAARTVTTLTDALRALEEYAMAGVTLGTDDSKRLHATVDRIAPIAARKVPEWQPIETAPKGNAVLIYYANEVGIGRIVKAIYVERFTEEADPESEDPEYNESDDTHYTLPGWYEMIDNWGDYSSVAIHHNPSHWMPLPAAPKVTP